MTVRDEPKTNNRMCDVLDYLISMKMNEDEPIRCPMKGICSYRLNSRHSESQLRGEKNEILGSDLSIGEY